MQNFRVILIGVYVIFGYISLPGAIAQTTKSTDGVSVSSMNLKDDMRYYQIVCEGHDKEYKDYYHAVRGKIVQKLKHNYRDRYCNGDVELFFVLNSNGSLGRIDVDLDRSTRDKKLIDVALLSLNQASPFLHFPKELDVAALPFSLTISFKENSN